MTRSPGRVESKISKLLRISSLSLSMPTLPCWLSNSGGNPQPVPKKDWCNLSIIHPPISTVAQPFVIAPPCAVASPSRAAGSPPISTVADPLTIALGGPGHAHKSPIRAAGIPPITPVGHPAGLMTPPQFVLRHVLGQVVRTI